MLFISVVVVVRGQLCSNAHVVHELFSCHSGRHVVSSSQLSSPTPQHLFLHAGSGLLITGVLVAEWEHMHSTTLYHTTLHYNTTVRYIEISYTTQRAAQQVVVNITL